MPQYDEAWKEIIENLFEKFVYFYMPDFAVDVDFTKECEFLDKELQVISPESEDSKRFASEFALYQMSAKPSLLQWEMVYCLS